MQTAEGDSWKVAIKDEYDSLILNKTWSISQIPPGRTAIKSRWSSNSSLVYVAQLLASKPDVIDYGETFSPVVKYDTLRVILSFVAANNLEMSQLDIKTAFLYGKLDEKIYLQQPEGFVVAGKEKQVCRHKPTQVPLWAQTSLKGVECHFRHFFNKIWSTPE